MRTALVAVVALALAGTAAGAPEAETLTHGQLVKRAFRICADASNAIARVRPALTFSGAARATGEVNRQLRRAVGRLAGLEPPREDAGELRRYIRLLRREVATLERARRAAQRGDRPVFRAAYDDAADVSRRAQAVASRLGLDVCSTI